MLFESFFNSGNVYYPGQYSLLPIILHVHEECEAIAYLAIGTAQLGADSPTIPFLVQSLSSSAFRCSGNNILNQAHRIPLGERTFPPFVDW